MPVRTIICALNTIISAAKHDYAIGRWLGTVDLGGSLLQEKGRLAHSAGKSVDERERLPVSVPVPVRACVRVCVCVCVWLCKCGCMFACVSHMRQTIMLMNAG